eukprot:1158096-Pelagomonas_calceolata.AAC.10
MEGKLASVVLQPDVVCSLPTKTRVSRLSQPCTASNTALHGRKDTQSGLKEEHCVDTGDGNNPVQALPCMGDARSMTFKLARGGSKATQ